MTKTNRLEVMERVEKFLSDLVDCHDLTEPASDGGISVGMVFQHDAKWLRTMLARHRIETNTKREHVMPGDPHDICNIALQWYLKFDFGYPHSVRESNIAVEGFKDGYRAALSVPQSITPPEVGGELERVKDALSAWAQDTPSARGKFAVIRRGAKVAEFDELDDAEDHARELNALAAIAALSTPEASDTKGLVDALRKAAVEFDLILMRLRDEQPERAQGAAICGARDARAALAQHRGSTL